MTTVTRLRRAAGPMALAEATRRFLRRDTLEASTRATYGRTLTALTDAVGADTDVAAVTTEQLEDELLVDRQVEVRVAEETGRPPDRRRLRRDDVLQPGVHVDPVRRALQRPHHNPAGHRLGGVVEVPQLHVADLSGAPQGGGHRCDGAARVRRKRVAAYQEVLQSPRSARRTVVARADQRRPPSGPGPERESASGPRGDRRRSVGCQAATSSSSSMSNSGSRSSAAVSSSTVAPSSSRATTSGSRPSTMSMAWSSASTVTCP